MQDTKHQPKYLLFCCDHLGRQFKITRYDLYPWLECYQRNETEVAAFCFYCEQAMLQGLPTTSKSETVFSETGYTNWKQATLWFADHEGWHAHQ